MVEIVLTNGSIALVDDIDADIALYTWNPLGHCAMNNTLGLMHYVVFNRMMGKLPLPANEIDHANRNSLDNRRGNLREATRQQNSFNRKPPRRLASTSQYKGVSFSSGKYRCTIKCGDHAYELGRYEDEIVAAKVYDAAARRFFGEFAYLNFPESNESEIQMVLENVLARTPRTASTHKWVHHCKNGLWEAKVRLPNKHVVYIGRFKTAEEGVEARKRYMEKHAVADDSNLIAVVTTA